MSRLGAIRGMSVALLLAGLTFGSTRWHRWPDVSQFQTRNPESTAFIHRERGAGAVAIRWDWVPLDQISPHLVRAILVAEDIEFFSHRGFAWWAIRAAVTETVREGSSSFGGSTITQQLAKNLWLSPERTVWRKLKEAALTVQLERDLSKQRILELYLNVVAFGPGVFGAEAAAQRYFAKPALFLTEREGAQLAAGLSRPSTWNPSASSEAYLARVDLVLRRMQTAEFLWRHIATW